MQVIAFVWRGKTSKVCSVRMEETFMYMAVISGWDEVKAFSEDEEKAKKLAIRKKKEYCKDDLDKWNWENVKNIMGLIQYGSKKAWY